MNLNLLIATSLSLPSCCGHVLRMADRAIARKLSP
jgi:hypothetical protein